MDRYDAGKWDYSGFEDAHPPVVEAAPHLRSSVLLRGIRYSSRHASRWAVPQAIRKGAGAICSKAESSAAAALLELFSAAGIRFDFSPKTIEPLVNGPLDELSKLSRTGDSKFHFFEIFSFFLTLSGNFFLYIWRASYGGCGWLRRTLGKRVTNRNEVLNPSPLLKPSQGGVASDQRVYL